MVHQSIETVTKAGIPSGQPFVRFWLYLHASAVAATILAPRIEDVLPNTLEICLSSFLVLSVCLVLVGPFAVTLCVLRSTLSLPRGFAVFFVELFITYVHSQTCSLPN